MPTFSYDTSLDVSDGSAILTITATDTKLSSFSGFTFIFRDPILGTTDLASVDYALINRIYARWNEDRSAKTVSVKISEFNADDIDIDIGEYWWADRVVWEEEGYFGTVSLVGNDPDTAGPTLKNLVIPDTLRVGGDAAFAFKIRTVDDKSGTANVTVTFADEIGYRTDTLAFDADDLLDGVLSTTAYISPTYNRAQDDIRIARITLTDRSGNEAVYSEADLIELGYDTTTGLIRAEGFALEGDDGDNLLEGFDGDDTLSGGAGKDTLIGGDGVNVLDGGDGADSLYISNGYTKIIDNDDAIDTLYLEAGDRRYSFWPNSRSSDVEKIVVLDAGGLTAYGLFRDNLMIGNAGGDTFNGRYADDTLKGEGGDDTLTGDVGQDYLIGSTGHDYLRGGDGEDRLVGGKGRDTIYGGHDNDVLLGRKHADLLIGGAGKDVFVFTATGDSNPNNTDIIARGQSKAFNGPGKKAGDLIDLSGIDAAKGKSGNQAFVFDGTDRDGGKGHLWLKDNKNGQTVVLGNVDGDKDAEFKLFIDDGNLAHAADYRFHDFIL